jgi:hypothetical protein
VHLDAEALQLPAFDNYVPVTENSDFGKGCPKKAFGPDGFIRHGKAVLCATLKGYHEQQRRDPKEIMGKQLKSFNAGHDIKRDDGTQAGVKNETFTVDQREPDEFAAENGYEA